MAANGGGELLDWFRQLMDDELEREERRRGEDFWRGEAVEALVSELLVAVGRAHEEHVREAYIEGGPRGSEIRTERACARVANWAAMIADVVREERS